MEAPPGPEMRVEGVGEGEGVDDVEAARVVSHGEHRSLRRDSLESTHLGAEVDIHDLAVEGKRFPNELLIARAEQVVGVSAKQVPGRGRGGSTSGLDGGPASAAD